jgi:subtilisin family serine protease
MEGFRTRPALSSLVATFVASIALALVPAGASAARGGVPNDRSFATQWQLTGNGVMGAKAAWGVSTGEGVTVAVLDTGAQLDHPDLAANLWVNEGEIAGNGIDDDGNGYADDVHGYDFAGKDADPTDGHGHGTSIAGVIAARGNNGIGIAGVAYRAKLMIVEVLGANGSGSVYDVAKGIRYATANGAQVINLSMAGPDTAPELEAAIADATAAGVLVVAAAGNNGADLDSKPAYPASSPNVIGVASTDDTGLLAPGSAYGAKSVEIAAPGENIVSTSIGGGYDTRSGTSQAAAHVSGVLALLAAAAPGASADTLRGRLLGSARAKGGLPVANGALDAAAALGAKAAKRFKVRKASQRKTLRSVNGGAPAPVSIA